MIPNRKTGDFLQLYASWDSFDALRFYMYCHLCFLPFILLDETIVTAGLKVLFAVERYISNSTLSEKIKKTKKGC